MVIAKIFFDRHSGVLRGALVALVVLACAAVSAETLKGRVVKVADGDTITVLASNVQHKVRLSGIDAPEKKQAFGEVSRRHLASLVSGKDVEVEWTKKDKYGRILGTVWVDVPAPDGKGAVRCDANRSMLYAGLAWHYKRFDSSKAYSDAESDARRARLGLWRDPNPVPPEEFRKSGSAVRRKQGSESGRDAKP